MKQVIYKIPKDMIDDIAGFDISSYQNLDEFEEFSFIYFIEIWKELVCLKSSLNNYFTLWLEDLDEEILKEYKVNIGYFSSLTDYIDFIIAFKSFSYIQISSEEPKMMERELSFLKQDIQNLIKLRSCFDKD